MRSLSEVIALLVIVGVAISITIGVFIVALGLLEEQKPRSTDLSVKYAVASLRGDSLVIRLTLVPIGTESIRLEGITIYKGTTRVSYTSGALFTSQTLSPGSPNEVIFILSGVTGINPGDTIVVLLRWHGITTGINGATKTEIVVS